MTAHLTRRRLLGAGLSTASLTALGGALTACGGDTATPDAAGSPSGVASGSSSPSAGPWTWTDALDQTVTLDSVPTRIAAYGDQAVALINFGITPVAMFSYTDPKDDAAFDGVDLDGVEIIGTTYGEINLEKLAALQPDLVLTTFYTSSTPDTMYGFKDKAQIAKVRQIAPITGVMQSGSALDVIGVNEKLAASLGVDVTAGQVASDKAAFEQASAALTTAAGSGLTVLPVYAEDANLYLAKAPDDPALTYYASLGLDFVPVGGTDYYWDVVSWENADTYSPDIVLYSLRDSYTPAQLQDQPVFATLPALRAGQLHPWKFKAMDYRSQAGYLTELAGWVSSDTKVT